MKSNQFAVRLAFPGLSHLQTQEILVDLQHELQMRPHLKQPRVSFDQVRQCAVVDVEDEAPTPEQVARNLAEELFEATCAILTDTAGLRVQVLQVRPIEG